MAINFFSINGTGGGGGGGITVVHTANGISGDGTVGTPVILGGLLNQATEIDASDFDLDIVQFLSNPDAFVKLKFFNNTILQLIAQHAAGVQAGVTVGGISSPHPFWNMVLLDAGTTKAITAQNNIEGIDITDTIQHIGLNGNELFPLSGNPNQYAQYGNIASKGGATNSIAANTTIASVIHTAGVGNNELVRVNVSALFTTFGAGAIVDFSIDYTDVLGNARNAVLGTINTVDPTSFPAIVLAIHDSNTVILSGILSGTPGAIFNAYANIEVLNVLP